jgi:subtilisin-like proprotein convertase family protein
MRSLSLSFMLLCSLLATSVFAQPQPILRPSSVPTLALPALDNASLLEEELSLRVPGRAPHFAEVRKVNIRPETEGVWEANNDGTTTWRMRISSPNAESINLGFTEFLMPQGGELYLHTGKKDNWEVRGPYTPSDNEVHNQLWTPILNSDEVVVEVTLPESERSNLRLWLTDVNHDFLGFAKNIEKSGSCNLDVVCGAADSDGSGGNWAIVDQYRDIIRSVVVYSRGGGTFCTGFLVNNVTQDGTPYFMTADHCGMTAGNAASLVTYYNFENSTCRAVGSAASGGGGNGVLDVNNTGAIFRASNPASDMTLLELDDPIPAAANAFQAGWDNTYNAPVGTIIAVHHPNTDEKRISFTAQQTFFTNGINGPANAAGTHLEIPDWDIGTTEPGSSGSPVFDDAHRVRGQLHGGAAACGNNAYDSYGAVARSWEGGGSSSTRLRDWLDPNNTGATAIDGRDVNGGSVASSPSSHDACGTEQVVYTLTIGGGFTSNVTLSIEDLPNGLSASYSQNPVAPGGSVSLTISSNSAMTGAFNFTVTATDGGDSDMTALALNLAAGTPAAPSAVAPADNESDVTLVPTLDWAGTGTGDYEYELALDAGMTNIVEGGTTDVDEFTPGSALDQSTTYFWRAREVNDCGTSSWSSIRQFTTLALACGGPQESVNVPLALGASGIFTSDLSIAQTDLIESIEINLDLSHSYVGDLEIRLEGPDGGTVILVDRIGYTNTGFGCSEDDLVLSFSDMAPNSAADLEGTCNVAPAASGSYQPVESLSVFSNEAANGTWTLIIDDQVGGDDGILNSWSMTICTSDASFPVELIGFTGAAKECSYALNWSVAREENFSHYEVEKSTDGRAFTALTRMEGGRRDYTLTDESAKGQAYYRLKMVDLDGTYAYSNLLSAETECSRNNLVSLYPNPVGKSRMLQLDFTEPLTTATSFTVFSADGRKLLDRNVVETAGRTASLNIGELPAGTYFLRVVSGGQTEVRSFVVM